MGFSFLGLLMHNSNGYVPNRFRQTKMQIVIFSDKCKAITSNSLGYLSHIYWDTQISKFRYIDDENEYTGIDGGITKMVKKVLENSIVIDKVMITNDRKLYLVGDDKSVEYTLINGDYVVGALDGLNRYYPSENWSEIYVHKAKFNGIVNNSDIVTVGAPKESNYYIMLDCKELYSIRADIDFKIDYEFSYEAEKAYLCKVRFDSDKVWRMYTNGSYNINRFLRRTTGNNRINELEYETIIDDGEFVISGRVLFNGSFDVEIKPKRARGATYYERILSSETLETIHVFCSSSNPYTYYNGDDFKVILNKYEKEITVFLKQLPPLSTVKLQEVRQLHKEMFKNK